MVLPGRPLLSGLLCRGGAALLAFALGLLVAGPAGAQASVQRVEVRIVFEGPAPHAVVQERLAATVQSVADRLLVGRPVDQVTPLAPQLGAAVADVVGRVASGYTLDPVLVHAGAVTVIEAHFRPQGPVLQEIAVLPDLSGIHARLRPIAANALAERAAPAIRSLYAGLPQAALFWAGPLLEARAVPPVEEALPGFTAEAIRVRAAGEAAEVGIEIGPRDTRVIRNVGVRFRSSSVPSMLLEQHGPAVASMAAFLRGIPVVFAQAYAQALAEFIGDELRQYPPARQYGIAAAALLEVGETTYVTVLAESMLYRGRVEAQLNVGTRAPGPALVGHLGRVVAHRAEVFGEIHLVPNTLSLDWHAGAVIQLSPSITVGAAYAVVAAETRLWTGLRLGLDTGLRAAWTLPAQTFEGALIYRFNDFLSGELVATSRGEWWLRLISNL